MVQFSGYCVGCEQDTSDGRTMTIRTASPFNAYFCQSCQDQMSWDAISCNQDVMFWHDGLQAEVVPTESEA